ncbi:glutathione S-transferase N-terminal domain-containing protein [Acidisoma cellulosilytica]|uniref:Glutathione S-transferase N-terminal domain-containing protein n=1 Tax=Acidisoma cellulosilyticum TaxID=2802395 RepID=A0A963YYR8_9PROT|nr:glutathione S-transferase N-terminal domain-containing protein [Acidisoma cellulosilyticum]MCB8879622.1 glutathione S-transferase N-terminal domain-containing protein [Acidisoma cellulosilyticum]
MKLFYSPTSPFVRKVVLAAKIREIDSQIELVPTDAHSSPAALLSANPLSKVPCLMTEDGVALFDSPVICEYLDSLGDAPPLFPDHGGVRWTALRQQALADGMMDAAVLGRMESVRPQEETRAKVIERQKAAVTRGLALLEETPPEAGHPTIGTISVACMLGYLDFRFAADDWRAGHPRLARWLESFVAATPAFAETAPPV